MLLAGFLSVATAWTDNGHMLVGQIAKNQLDVNDFSFITEHFYSKEFLDTRKDFPSVEDTDDLTGVAVWMDSANIAFPYQRNWHFIDTPYSLDGTKCKSPDGEQTIIWALKEAMHGLGLNHTKYDDPAAIQFFHGFWIRALVHFMGDLHQPLHNMEGCSKRFPHGDRGGNEWKIHTDIYNTYHGHTREVNELHLLWDLGGGKYLDNWPLSNAQRANLEEEAIRLQKQFSKSSFPDVEYENLGSFEKWHKEGFKLGPQVYNMTGAPFDKNITEDYKNFVQETAQSQITLAGYRLGSVLKSLPIYKKTMEAAQKFLHEKEQIA